MSKLRIMIVDDHEIFRAGIKSIFENDADIEIVGEAGNGREAVEKAAQLQPDLVLMDLSMPEMDGIEATRQIKKAFPGINVIILTVHDDEEFFLPALRSGASGYVVKESEPQELLYAIRLVSSGRIFLSPAVVSSLVKLTIETTGKGESYLDILTEREKEILKLAATGKTNRQMAQELFLSIRTVEKYRQAVMDKLGLSTREELQRFALRKGIIDLEI